MLKPNGWRILLAALTLSALLLLSQSCASCPPHGSAEIPLDWPAFLDDFQRHWPTDGDNTYVDFLRDGICGNGAARSGDPRWRRLTEIRAGAAKSVFHFDVQGSVA